MQSINFIMGVSGSGKTTVGKLLAHQTVIPFFDADDFHPPANIEKMKAGVPLTDQDREEWLQQLNQLAFQQQNQNGAIIACSALKEKYRQQLSSNLQHPVWIYLKGNYDLIHERLEQRPHHFFSADLLQSQFEALEEPADPLTINTDQPPEMIVEEIVKHIHMSSSFGIIGLGVMGRNIALNCAGKGIRLSLYNRFVSNQEEKVAEQLIASHAVLDSAKGFESLEAFVQSLKTPRKILLMVNAGKATDDVLQELKIFLTGGDVIIDGGNSFYKDTERRMAVLAENKIHLIGAGISGGEEGALNGPSIMPGGDTDAFEKVKPVLEAIAAKDINGNPCCAYVSAGGSGHFVKMVHNAIEYAEMQLLGEVYFILRNGFQLKPDAVAAVFAEWNETELESYLLEITIAILSTKEQDDWLIDKILDVGSSKGTGSWAVAAAAELGVPAGMMTAALYARYLSTHKMMRVKLNDLLPHQHGETTFTINELKEAYQLARIINHHQGFELIRAAAKKYHWSVALNELARIWTNGCIIRSQLMETFAEILSDPEILLHPFIINQIQQNQSSLKSVVSASLKNGWAVPAFSEALNYLLAISTSNSAMNLVQAQRDYFGAHTYQRTDDPTGAAHHTRWKAE